MVSVITQGLVSSKDDVENIISFKKFTDDVILVTWKNHLNTDYKEKLEIVGIRIIEIDDPGSEKAYQENGILKYLNVNRRIVSYQKALQASTYDKVVITRTDIQFDINITISSFDQNNKKIAVTNINSINPYQFLAPEYYCSMCDWIFVSNKKYLLEHLKETNENSLQLKKSYSISSQTWYSVLSAEQIFTLLLIGEKLDIQRFNNTTLNGRNNLKHIHESKLKEKFLILHHRSIKLKSTKFRYFTQDWISYQNSNFKNTWFDNLLNFRSLLIFLLSKIKSLF